MTHKNRKKIRLLAIEILMILIALVYIYPVYLMFMNSVKPFGEVVADVIKLPGKIEWQNYVDVIEKMNYQRLFLNNLIITSIGIVGIVIFSASTAYILDRRRTKYTKFVHLAIITPMLIPFQTIMITLLKVMNVVNLNNSTWGLGIQ